MSIEKLRTYPNHCRNGWQDLIIHEEQGMGSVCVNGQGEYFNTCIICNKYIYIHLFVYVNLTKMYNICEHHLNFSSLMNEDFNIMVEASGSHNQDDMLENVRVF